MKIGVPKETAEGERRVALIPDVVKSLKKNEKVDVGGESGAGEAAGHTDEAYKEAGAEVGSADSAWGADIVLHVAVPSVDSIGRLDGNQLLISTSIPGSQPTRTKLWPALG